MGRDVVGQTGHVTGSSVVVVVGCGVVVSGAGTCTTRTALALRVSSSSCRALMTTTSVSLPRACESIGAARKTMALPSGVRETLTSAPPVGGYPK